MTLSMHKATKSRSRDWTPEEDAIIRLALKRRAPAEQILPLLDNRTLSALQNRAKRLGLSITTKMNAVALTKPAGLDGEIIKLCSYITNDSYIANYLGTTTEHVAGLRRRTPPKPRGSEGGPGRPQSADKLVPIGMEAEAVRRSAAANGSAALRDAMIIHFGKVARERGVSIDDAARICLSGRFAPNIFTTKGNANV